MSRPSGNRPKARDWNDVSSERETKADRNRDVSSNRGTKDRTRCANHTGKNFEYHATTPADHTGTNEAGKWLGNHATASNERSQRGDRRFHEQRRGDRRESLERTGKHDRRAVNEESTSRRAMARGSVRTIRTSEGKKWRRRN